jgi:hypothetical protein
MIRSVCSAIQTPRGALGRPLPVVSYGSRKGSRTLRPIARHSAHPRASARQFVGKLPLHDNYWNNLLCESVGY